MVGICLHGCTANGTSVQAPTDQTYAGRPPSPTDGNTSPSPTPTAASGIGNANDANNANNTDHTDPNTPAAQMGSPFLRIANDANGVAQIVRYGVPFYMLGYQADPPDVTNYCGWTGADMLAAFPILHTNSGANTVRVWFLQSAGGPADWTPFDRVIAAAKANNLVIVATLVNQWGDCEPNVNGAKNYKGIAWYQTGYKQTNDGYPLSYRDFAQAVVAHYANEPTIALWQLVNESEARDIINNACPSESASASAIRAFADDMATLLHTTDPNHLVNLGTQDNGYCGVNGNDFKYVQAGAVDLCETHSYEPGNITLPPLVAQDIAQCRSMNKPIFMGEVGICRNVQADGTCSGSANSTTLQQRATFFGQKLRAGPSAGLSGMLIWQYNPEPTDADYGIFPNDPVENVMLHL